jgi:hypothetical protein
MAVTRSGENFNDVVKEWVILDNEMQKLQDQMKEMRQRKQDLSNVMMDTLQSKNKLHYTMEMPDSQLRFQTRKEYGNLSFQYIEKCFQSLIVDNEQRNYVLKYLKEHREVKEVTELKRSYKKIKNNNV